MFELRPYLLYFLIFFLLFLSLQIPSAKYQEALSLEQLVAHSIEANPRLAAMNAKVRALAEIPPQKGSLPDPHLTLRLANFPLDTFSNTQEPMTQMQIGLSQNLPYPGKLALRQQVATIEGEAAENDLDEMRLKLIRGVKTLWWNMYYLDKALETVGRNQVLLSQFVAIAQTKYQVGKGLQQDVLLAQLELSKLLEMRLAFENMRYNEAERLNILLDYPVDQTIELKQIKEVLFPTDLSLQNLIELANKNRPLLTGLQKRLEAANFKVALAKKSYYPDFTLGVTYGYRNGINSNGTERDDFGTVAFGMNLPFFSDTSNDHALSQRREEKIQVKLELKSSRKKIEAEVSTAISDFKRAGGEMTLFKQGIIPQARQTVDSMLAGYQVNTVDFLNLIGAQTSLHKYETRYWKAFSSANQALARLVAAVGTEEIYE